MALFMYQFVFFCSSLFISNLVLKNLGMVNTHLVNTHIFFLNFYASKNLNFKKW
jgi:hypothetical protein